MLYINGNNPKYTAPALSIEVYHKIDMKELHKGLQEFLSHKAICKQSSLDLYHLEAIRDLLTQYLPPKNEVENNLNKETEIIGYLLKVENKEVGTHAHSKLAKAKDEAERLSVKEGKNVHIYGVLPIGMIEISKPTTVFIPEGD